MLIFSRMAVRSSRRTGGDRSCSLVLLHRDSALRRHSNIDNNGDGHDEQKRDDSGDQGPILPAWPIDSNCSGRRAAIGVNQGRDMPLPCRAPVSSPSHMMTPVIAIMTMIIMMSRHRLSLKMTGSSSDLERAGRYAPAKIKSSSPEMPREDRQVAHYYCVASPVVCPSLYPGRRIGVTRSNWMIIDAVM